MEKPKCLNGHAANSDGNCFDSTCVYSVANKNKGPSR